MKELITVSQLISKYVVGAEGNVSKKVNDVFFIKASGTSCANMTEDNIIKCSLNGTQLNNFDKKPSMEVGFHTWLLSLTDINYVVHTHPTNTLKILCTDYINEFDLLVT
jgi:ribulose-5-phosphate 4-epimerase/fuculose-1-phosphate aldolase